MGLDLKIIFGFLSIILFLPSCRLIDTYNNGETVSPAIAEPTPSPSPSPSQSPSPSPSPSLLPLVPTHLNFVSQPTNTNSSVVFATSISVEILTADNTRVTDSTATITAAIGANPSVGALSGTLSVAAVSGVATFSTLSINNVGSGYTLTAASAGLTSATSNAFNITSSNPAPTVTSVSPTSGPLEGGTLVTLTGTGFLSGATSTFGNGACTSVAVVSATSITCLTPAASAGAVTVTVTNTDSLSGNKASGFTYVDAPSAISTANLKLWVKADALALTDGNLVTSWTDSSGNNNHLTQATTDLKPTFKTNILNGKPVIRFSGGQQLSKAYSLNPTSYTVFVVAKNSDGHPMGSGIVFALGPTGNYDNALRVENTTGTILFGKYATEETSFQNSWADTTNFVLWSFTVSSTGSSKTVQISKNGVAFGTGTGAATLGGQWTNMTLGNWNTGDGYFFNGDIAEVLAYNSALSQTDLVTIESSLNAKYLIYAPKTHGLSRWGGGISGGETLSVYGSGFRQGATVTLDSTACTNSVFKSAKQLDCTVPAHSAGTINVKVTNPDNKTAIASLAYAYQNIPVTEPPDLTGLQYWLRADSGSYSNGSKIDLWSDSSTNNFQMPIAIDSVRPTYTTVGGKSVIRLSGSQQLTTPTSLSPASYTVFVVAKNSDGHPTGSGIVFALGPTGNYDNAFRVDNITGTVFFGKYATEETSYEKGWTDFLNPVLWSFVVSATGSSKKVDIYRNGAYLGQGTGAATLGGAWDNITVGNWNTGDGYFFNGDIYEVAVYNSALSTNNRSILEQYFNTKFGGLYPPKILGLSRWSSTTSGGDSLTVSGYSFTAQSKISLDTTDCSATTYVNPSQLICTSTPTHVAGLVNVKVTNPDGATAIAANAYSYQSALVTNPPDVSGLQYWMRADSSSFASGSKIDFWNDSSSNIFLIPGSAVDTQRPTYTTVGGKSVIRLSGAQQLTTPTSLSPASYTVFVVAKNSDGHPTGSGIVFALGPTGNYDNAFRVDNITGTIFFGKYATEETSYGGGWTDFLNPVLWSFVVSATGGSQKVDIYRNGVYLGQGTGAATLGGTWDNITVGNWNTGDGYFFNGDIYEVALYNSALSTTNRATLEQYFNTKFGGLNFSKILGLSRWSSTITGGDPLTVTGTGFTPNSKITLDTTDCSTTTYVDPSQLICTSTPAHAAGLVNVKVTHLDGTLSTATNSYSYQGALLINPIDISGLQYWMRADSSSYTSGSKVDFWMDSSSNHYSIITSPTDAARPTYTTVGGKSVIRMGGSQQFTTPTSLNPTAYTVFVVAKNSDGHPIGSGIVFALGPTGNYDNAFRVDNITGTIFFGKYATEETSFSNAWNNFSSPFAWVIQVAATGSSQTAKVFKNGSLLGTGSGPTTVGGAWDNITLGNWNTGDGYFFKGDYYEVLLYDTNLSDANITNVLNYLNTKFALW